jgi:PAS domain S-box-containing protein
MPTRLESRIILSVVLVLTTMITMYGWWIGSRQSEVYVQSLSDNLQVLTRSLADNAAHLMVIKEYAGLDERMLEAAGLPDVLSIQVLESDGTLICDVERTSLTAPPKVLYRPSILSVPSGSAASLTRDGDRLICFAPITAGKHLGWLKVVLSLHTAVELQSATWRSSLQIGIIWILVGTILMILVVRKPLKSIRELSSFAHNLQNCKGGQVSVGRGVYEIDLLADALNHSSVELLSAERRLLAEQERLSVTLQSIGDGVIATDKDSKVMLVNHVAELLTGWNEADAFGHMLGEVFSLERDSGLSPATDRLNAVLAECCSIELEGGVRLTSRTGFERIVTVVGAPIIDSTGNLVGMVLVFRDITEKSELELEKNKLQEQLIQSQKMESIGQLAGGVAHDFNNILTAIIGYGEMLRMKLGHDEKLASYADQVLASAERAANLTRSLLAFSRKQAIELQSADINAIVLDIQKLLGRLIGEDIHFTIRAATGPLRAMVDAGQLEQLLMNLATNARDAMPDGGELSIETDEVIVDETYSRSLDKGMPGRYALITVSDNGCGMDQETSARIFEPFYTTKQIGKGTGLGLSIVYGIVRQHNGFVTVYSEPGHGTSFRVYIPLSDEVLEKVSREFSEEDSRGSETILLVEDDSGVSAILELTLAHAGYAVITASNGLEAVEMFTAHHDDISLILMDVIMPTMNGKEAYGKISERFPEAKVIFMSGYTADVILHKGLMADDLNFLHKPVSKQQLLKKIREVLESEHAHTESSGSSGG